MPESIFCQKRDTLRMRQHLDVFEREFTPAVRHGLTYQAFNLRPQKAGCQILGDYADVSHLRANISPESMR